MSAITRRTFGNMTASAVVATLPIFPVSANEVPDMPVGACDCHVHIIGPSTQYPMVPQRAYTPPEASTADLLEMRRRLGIARNVLIQPSFYGTDNRAMLDAMARLGDTARGIAVVAPDIAAAELAKLDAQGVRGIRLNLESGENRDPDAAAAALDEMAKRIGHLGWHLQIYAALPVIAAIADRIAALPVDVVIDHFGLAQARESVNQPGFAALLELVRARKSSPNKSSPNKTYVKLSAPYRISQASGYADVAPIARALIAAAPDRMLWASDWPHTDRVPGRGPLEIHPFRTIDDRAALALLSEWCGDKGIEQTILVETPARLYRF
jgi:predicted TIM-barrel fold metal-dependent hydrolase